jgi:hypothetical protein
MVVDAAGAALPLFDDRRGVRARGEVQVAVESGEQHRQGERAKVTIAAFQLAHIARLEAGLLVGFELA